MATKKKMLQAAAGNATGGAVLNVEDVLALICMKVTEALMLLRMGSTLDSLIVAAVQILAAQIL